ncbi:MAG TPA: Hsp20/alpha crystallin family protein [Vicinamibacterales bacterium]|nr:Hsp20/alpha crystallin family protein [Vicinamibacterales bacterium]
MARIRDMMVAEPGALLRRMFRDHDPWLEPRFPLAGLRKAYAAVPWLPQIEMRERDRQLVITVELPALKKEEIGVNLSSEGLAIEGERTHGAERRNDEWFTTEQTYGRFYRVVPLPEGVDFKEVRATFRNGVLEISVPIPAAAARAPYRVPVEGEPQATTVPVAA